MTNSVMDDAQKVRAPWRKAYIFVLIIFLAYLGYRWFAFAMTQVQRSQQSDLQEAIATQDAEIAKAYESEDFVTYAAGKKLLQTNTDNGWLERLTRVIEIFTTLQNLGGGNVQFSDFKIDFDEISLKGTVPNLSYIYANNGVIDQFTSLEFITNVTIKDYQKEDNGFEFTLTADISLDGTSSK